MTKLRWKGQLKGQQYTLGSGWEAWRDAKNDGAIAVVFVSNRTTLETTVSSKAEASKWVNRQIRFIERQKWVYNVQCDESHALKLDWGRDRIPVKYVLHPDTVGIDMESVVRTLRNNADSLKSLDLGVVKYVDFDQFGAPSFLVAQKGKTYIMPLSPFACAERMVKASRIFKVEGLKRVAFE